MGQRAMRRRWGGGTPIPARAFVVGYVALLVVINAAEPARNAGVAQLGAGTAELDQLVLLQQRSDGFSASWSEDLSMDPLHDDESASIEPSLADDKYGDPDNSLMDGNEDAADMGKASEMGEKLQTKAHAWSDKARGHENKAKELGGKAGIKADGKSNTPESSETSQKEKDLEQKLSD